MNWSPLGPGDPGYRKNIEDRRAIEPTVTPSAPEALTRGLPQTPYEWEMYMRQLQATEAIKAGAPLPAQLGTAGPYGQEQPRPSKGDPAGIEARRAAIEARIAADQAALKELNSRLKLTKK